MNSLLSKPTNTQALTQVVSPYQLEVARKLSQSMADNQARELLATDILYKVGNLALIQAEILKKQSRSSSLYRLYLASFYPLHHTTLEIKEALMNTYLWLVLGCGLSLGVMFILDWLEDISKYKKTYTDEEIALAEFLEKKQSINDLYLQAHTELLRHLRR